MQDSFLSLSVSSDNHVCPGDSKYSSHKLFEFSAPDGVWRNVCFALPTVMAETSVILLSVLKT